MHIQGGLCKSQSERSTRQNLTERYKLSGLALFRNVHFGFTDVAFCVPPRQRLAGAQKANTSINRERQRAVKRPDRDKRTPEQRGLPLGLRDRRQRTDSCTVRTPSSTAFPSV